MHCSTYPEINPRVIICFYNSWSDRLIILHSITMIQKFTKFSKIVPTRIYIKFPNFSRNRKTTVVEFRCLFSRPIIHDSVGSGRSRKIGCKLGGATFTCMHASWWSLCGRLRGHALQTDASPLSRIERLVATKLPRAPGQKRNEGPGGSQRGLASARSTTRGAAKYLSRGVYTLRLRLFWNARAEDRFNDRRLACAKVARSYLLEQCALFLYSLCALSLPLLPRDAVARENWSSENFWSKRNISSFLRICSIDSKETELRNKVEGVSLFKLGLVSKHGVSTSTYDLSLQSYINLKYRQFFIVIGTVLCSFILNRIKHDVKLTLL